MKTPEEIKRGLEHCASYNPCFQCDYDARDWPRCVTRLHGDAKAYIQQLEQDNAQKDERIRQLEQRVPRWISVEERLPEDGVEVIVHSDRFGGSTHTAYYRHARQEWFEHNGVRLIPNVWHWMPLPAPPEEGES